MSYRGHLFVGILFSIFALSLMGYSFQTVDPFVYLLFGMLGALMPDLDHPEAYLSKKIPLGIFFLLAGAYFMYGYKSPYFIFLAILFFAFLVLPSFIYRTLGHRGPVHSLLPYSLLLIPAVFLVKDPFIPLFIYFGAVSHLVADAFSGNGIMFFWPYPKKYRGNFFIFLILAFVLAGIYFLFYNNLLFF